MAFDNNQRTRIYNRTSGRCHLCHKKLAFKNYGIHGARGAWEVEHSYPKAKGGTNHMNNLFAACISCNRAKGTSSTASTRAIHGKKKAPLSTTRRKTVKTENAILGGSLGALLGIPAGIVGIALGALTGAHIGHRIDPD
jgi:5-methylcytosine-specific restriction endonuclease McrA